MEDKLYIKFIDKSELLYELWKNAKPTHYFYECPEMGFIIDLDTVKNDIKNIMTSDGYLGKISFSVYQGKNIYIELTNDYLKYDLYNLLNGQQKAEKIVTELKVKEIKKSILKYYVSM
jgi:hypothetical protein